MKKILPELHFSCTYGNTIYSIPLFYDLGVLLYRRDLIEKLSDANKWSKKIKAGITWKDMFELKNKHFQNKPLYLFQAKAYEGLICNYIELGASLGTPIFRENEFLLIENNISSVIGFTLDLIHKINLVPADILQFDETNSLLFALENDIPMFRAWLTNINNIKFPEKFKEKVKNLEIALLPRKEGTSPAMALGGWNLIISKHSRHKKEAAAFLEFVISDRVQTELFNRGFYLPILAGLEATQKEQNSKMIQPLNNSWIKYSIRRPQNINYTRLSDIYSDLINKTLKGHINANDIYRIARERIE
jgi:multiple sugar transport system substrate-binding protein